MIVRGWTAGVHGGTFFASVLVESQINIIAALENVSDILINQ